MATHSVILAWKIPIYGATKESQRVRYDLVIEQQQQQSLRQRVMVSL